MEIKKFAKMGTMNEESINANFHEIDNEPKLGFYLMEHDNLGDETYMIVYSPEQKIYCFTEESLGYTLTNWDEFEWYNMESEVM